jgi:GTP-binding protein LepA
VRCLSICRSTQPNFNQEILSLFINFLISVSRSLAACEGALLVVDASQGVEAQTMANVYLALENNLEIITCVNKIDLPNADAEKVMQEVESTIGLDTSNSIKCSAKTGMWVPIRLLHIS